MGAPRYLAGLVCIGLFATACVSGPESEIDASDLNLDYDTADGPSLPPPPPNSTCAFIQRGVLGQVQDTDISLGNGASWTMGGYPFTWTGPSPYQHWSAYQFDLGVVPAGANVVLATFTTVASWNMQPKTIRAHRIIGPWSEATTTWSNFTNNGAITNWDPAVLGSFDVNGGGYRSIDVTGLTQQWVSGAVANNGLLLEGEGDPPASHVYFASESSTANLRPSLFVCWSNEAACVPLGGMCNAANPCCDGTVCNDGTCGAGDPGGGGGEGGSGGGGEGGGSPVCANPGEACNAATPCCGGICNDGVCSGGGGGGGGGECAATGSACGADAECCSGSCFDGACVATNICVPADTYAACDPANPCCDGAHCVLDTCFPLSDIPSCAIAGGSCNPDAGVWCCWGMQCNANGQCE